MHTVQLKPMIKAQIPGRMVSSGISDVVTSEYSEKTRLKKLMMIMIIITSNRKTIYYCFLINGFSVTSFCTFSRTPYHPYIGAGISWREGIKMVSASTPSANEPAKF